MTVTKIKKVYNKFDSKFISLNTSAHEGTTPVRVLFNAAVHLSGAARSLGAVLVGHTGVHMFHPQPVATVLNDIGGMSILLGFVAMANDVEGLYAAVKALVCVLKSTHVALQVMHRINGYQVVIFLQLLTVYSTVAGYIFYSCWLYILQLLAIYSTVASYIFYSC